MARNNWTREEHILAFNLYCKTPFAKIGSSYAPVKDLAAILGRSDNSVAMKLANFARLDPALKTRNVTGLSRGAQGEEDIWNEFNDNWENLAFESEQILARHKRTRIDAENNPENNLLFSEGIEREALVKIRVNQRFFRKAVLASYNSKCCITGINLPGLLVAGHIVPWAANPKHRVNPANGLCLNAIHDRAFDIGLITVTPDYTIVLSEKLLSGTRATENENFFLPYNGRKITLPHRFVPLREFLEYHNHNVFMK